VKYPSPRVLPPSWSCPACGGTSRGLPFDAGDQLLQGIEDRRQAMNSALLGPRGPCGLPAPGQCRQRIARENREAGQRIATRSSSAQQCRLNCLSSVLNPLEWPA